MELRGRHREARTRCGTFRADPFARGSSSGWSSRRGGTLGDEQSAVAPPRRDGRGTRAVGGIMAQSHGPSEEYVEVLPGGPRASCASSSSPPRRRTGRDRRLACRSRRRASSASTSYIVGGCADPEPLARRDGRGSRRLQHHLLVLGARRAARCSRSPRAARSSSLIAPRLPGARRRSPPRIGKTSRRSSSDVSARLRAVFFDVGNTLLYPHPSRVRGRAARSSPRQGTRPRPRRHRRRSCRSSTRTTRTATARTTRSGPSEDETSAVWVGMYSLLCRRLGIERGRRGDRAPRLRRVRRPDALARLRRRRARVRAAARARACALGIISNWDSRLRRPARRARARRAARRRRLLGRGGSAQARPAHLRAGVRAAGRAARGGGARRRPPLRGRPRRAGRRA